MLLLSAQPLRVYWYRDCLVRFATHKYDMKDINNQYAHLTNTSINKHSGASGVGGCKWSMHRFKREHPVRVTNPNPNPNPDPNPNPNPTPSLTPTQPHP